MPAMVGEQDGEGEEIVVQDEVQLSLLEQAPVLLVKIVGYKHVRSMPMIRQLSQDCAVPATHRIYGAQIRNWFENSVQ